jgi:transforming growth factor-beta-induced protein
LLATLALASAHSCVKELSNPNYSTLVSLLGGVTQAEQLIASLPTPYTIVAPTNAAFTPQVVQEFDSLTPAEQTDFLLGHIVANPSLPPKGGAAAVPFTSQSSTRVWSYFAGKTQYTNDVQVQKRIACSGSNAILSVNTVLFPVNDSIAALATATPELSTLLSLVVAAGLAPTFSGAGTFTLFAPTNTAFTNLEAACPGVTAYLLANIPELTNVLTYHVLGSAYFSPVLTTGDVTTLNGETVSITVSTTGVEVNNANVILANVAATNGVVHVIDAVLVPPSFSFTCSTA